MTDTFNKPVNQNLFTGDDKVIPGNLTEEQEIVVKMAWIKLDDLFDSREGGPHLKERSLTGWDAEKSALLLSYVMGIINYGNPPLSFNIENFPYQTDGILVAQGLVVQIIRHLIRSYVEQPTPQGTGYSHLSRKDYVQLWQSVLDKEEEEFNTMLVFFRRRFLDIGSGAGLVSWSNTRWGYSRYRGLMHSRGGRFYRGY